MSPKEIKRCNSMGFLERVKGIEPSYSAWKATGVSALPFNISKFSVL